MRRFRNILAVTLVALALCADRATAAVPAVRPHISQVTRQVVREVTRRFQRVVPAVKIVQHRQDGFTRVAPQDLPTHVPAGLHDSQGTPFQFRLPPPAV
jgi:hypothetical protein